MDHLELTRSNISHEQWKFITGKLASHSAGLDSDTSKLLLDCADRTGAVFCSTDDSLAHLQRRFQRICVDFAEPVVEAVPAKTGFTSG